VNKRSWQYIHGVVLVMGLVLLVGGIVTRTSGAWIIGLIVAAVNLGHWQRSRKQSSTSDKARPQR
jgi:hypothetical protein